MTYESLPESEFVSDEMQTTDSYVVDEIDDDVTDSLIYAQPSLLSQIIGFFFQTPARRKQELSWRLSELNDSIRFAPNSPTNYVLRGELFLERREYHLAKADFETVLEIAESFDARAGWGVIEQTMRDRALDGLAKVQHRS